MRPTEGNFYEGFIATGVASEATDAAIQVGGFPLVFPRRARAWLSKSCDMVFEYAGVE